MLRIQHVSSEDTSGQTVRLSHPKERRSLPVSEVALKPQNLDAVG